MRDYRNIEKYLNKLSMEIYAQPEDCGHTSLSRGIIDLWMNILVSCKSVLDVGCGTGFCQTFFEKYGVSYTGITLGLDVIEAQKNMRSVTAMDFSFLDFPDESFDLVFSRHSLEHSPMPLLTLMEWYRVSKQWLGVVLPAVEHFTVRGSNHYYMLTCEQWTQMFENAGWRVIWDDVVEIEKADGIVPFEYRFLLEKKR